MKKFLAVLVALVAAAWFAVPAFAGTQDPNGGYLEICKTSTTITSGVFAFQIQPTDTVNSDVSGRTILVNVGECSPELWVGTGQVTVREINYQDSQGFNTNDWTTLTSVHTVAPGAPDQQLVGIPDLESRTAVVNVNSGGSSQGTTVKFNDELSQGYFEICKTQVSGAGLDGQTFNFKWQGAMGAGGTVGVIVGGCSFPIYAPSGHVNIAEDPGTYTYVDTQQDPTDGTWGISSSTDSLLDWSIADATAVVAVGQAAPGATSDESIVTFRNNSSLLKICKVVPDTIADTGATYTFNVNGTSYTVHGFNFRYDPDRVYGCVLVNGGLRAGTSVTVTEQPQPGQLLDAIWFEPKNASATFGGTDYTGQWTTFDMQSGTNEVFFANVPADEQLLKICKTGGPASTSVTFDVAGPVGEAPDVTAGTLKVAVPLDSTGAGCAEAGYWSYIGPVTVAEEIPTGFAVSAISANGAEDSNGNRLASSDLGTGSAVVYIGAGTTIVSYTNGAAAATVTPPASGSTGGVSAVTTGASATASTASTSAPTAVSTTSKVAKTTKAATMSVSAVRILSINKGRFVYVRINGAAKTARIHLTLIGANHKILKSMTRYVVTNKSVRVKNLRLGTSVRVVSVSL